MKIAVADNCNYKFTQDLINHWVEQGHEVKCETGASEKLAQWADIYWVDFWDNNIHYLWKLYHPEEHPNDVSRTPDWDNNKKPLIVCRAMDWEVWIGLARDQRIIDWVDKAICIAPHIEKKLREDNEWHDLKVIRPGVNMEKFTLKTKQTDGFQIGMVLGDMWVYKNHMAGLDIFTTLYKMDNRWRLHIRGQHEPGEYNVVMFNHYLKSRGIEDVVTLYPKVEDMNAWYEDIDILLHPGMKEAFCYAVAEAAAKGLRPLCNNFYGSEDIWSDAWTYNTHAEAIEKFLRDKKSGWGPEIIRMVVEKNYSLEKMCKEIDDYLGIPRKEKPDEHLGITA